MSTFKMMVLFALLVVSLTLVGPSQTYSTQAADRGSVAPTTEYILASESGSRGATLTSGG